MALAPAAAAGTWQLGDRTVNRLGLGAMRLTGTGAFDEGTPSDRNRSVEVLRRAVALGVNHVDTAAFYFSSTRSANELVNTALAPYQDDLVIVTKVGPGRDPSGEWLSWARPDQLRGQVEENIRQLGLDQLDVVNLRLQGTGSVAEHVGALSDLRDAGLLRNIGISNARLHQVEEALGVAAIACVQNRFAIDTASIGSDEVLRFCGERGIAFVPFFAIAGSGREGGAGTEQNDAVSRVAQSHEVSAAQVRLAWTLHQGPHVLAIPGTGNPGHVADNVAAAALRLSDEDLAALSF